jgi:hypothetical protein
MSNKMKKTSTLIILFLLILASSFGQDYNSYQIEEIAMFSFGQEPGELMKNENFFPGFEAMGPGAICFDEKGNFFVYDKWKSRVVGFNQSYEYKEEYLDSGFGYEFTQEWHNEIGMIQKINDGVIKYFIVPKILVNQSGTYSFIDLFSSSFNKSVREFNFLTNSGCVFFWLKDGSILSILNPGPDPAANNRRILNTEQTLALFEEPQKYGLEGVTIDDKNRLFLYGELQTRDYKTFYEYWNELHNELYKHKFNPLKLKSASYATYLNIDTNKNTYWDIGGLYIYVFDSDGWVIELFKYQDSKSKTCPAIHPNGDVYFLDYDVENVYLRRIKNVWDPIEWEAPGSDTGKQYGTLNDSRVRVRDFPNTEGKHLGYLDIEQRVEIIGRTATEMKIGDMNSVWYKIRTEDGLEGWAYGYFIDVEE